MATTLVVVMWIVTLSASRYADYSNEKMPQYGGNEYDNSRDTVGHLESDDYQDHSADAAVSLDYKYDEEIKEEQCEKLDKIPEIPNKRQKQKSSCSTEANILENRHNYGLNIEKVPEIRRNHRNMRLHSKLKHRSFKRYGEDLQSCSFKYGSNRDNGGIHRKEYFDIDNDVGAYRRKNMDDDNILYVRKHTTEKIIQRKPRGKLVNNPSDLDAEFEELAPDRQTIGDSRDYVYKLRNDDTRDIYVNPIRATQEIYRPIIVEDEERPSTVPYRYKSKYKGKTYDDYSNYYDKKIYGIKNKPPTVLRRRTTVREKPTSKLPIQLEDSLRQLLNLSDIETDSTADFSSRTPESTTSSSAVTSTPTKARVKKNHSILLKYIHKIVTVVGEDPGTSLRPQLRVDHSSDGSPGGKRKVKLIRKKMIVKGQDMDTVNENWDQMACDNVETPQRRVKTSNAVENRPHTIIDFLILLVCIQ